MNTGCRRGFTLVETLVALLIITIAYTAATTAVGQFVDQRIRLMERHSGHRIAWNRLMEQYLVALGRAPAMAGSDERSGAAVLAGETWQWRMTVDAAAGKNLVRYEVEVSRSDGAAPGYSVRSLSAFFVSR